MITPTANTMDTWISSITTMSQKIRELNVPIVLTKLLLINFVHFSSDHEIKPFLQVVRDVANAIGCASVSYEISIEDSPLNVIQTSCVFSHGLPNEGSPVYVTGNGPSGCKNGTSPDYINLCLS